MPTFVGIFSGQSYFPALHLAASFEVDDFRLAVGLTAAFPSRRSQLWTDISVINGGMFFLMIKRGSVNEFDRWVWVDSRMLAWLCSKFTFGESLRRWCHQNAHGFV